MEFFGFYDIMKLWEINKNQVMGENQK